MKLNIIGIKRIKGDKSKAGHPYDICSIFALVPIEQSQNEKMTISGKGYEIAELPFDVEHLPISSFQDFKFPQLVELHMDSRPRFGKFESVVVGFDLVGK